MDLIDREQAISKLEDLIIARRGWLSDGTAEIRGIDAAICELVALPSAEKTGRWVMFDGKYFCSNCGKQHDYRTYNCPNCGATMEWD